MLLTVLAAVVVLGVLIFVHELGHFLVAKAVGVRVERFSLGFPPKAVGKKIGETEYILSWIPLGGYVKMFGENPDEEGSVPSDQRHRSFSHKPAWARFLIVVAGASFNLIFTVLIYWSIFFFHGYEQLVPTVGRLTDGGPAMAAGLEPGDRITAVGQKAIRYYGEVEDAVNEANGRPLILTVDRGGQARTFSIIPRTVTEKDLFGGDVQVWDLGFRVQLSAVVGGVRSGEPADLAGVKPGDRITFIDGQTVRDWYDILTFIRGSQGNQVVVTVVRDGATLDLTIRPKFNYSQEPDGSTVKTPIIGIESRGDVLIEEMGLIRSMSLAGQRTWDMIRLTYLTVAKLFQAQLSVKTLGGPLFIAELAGSQARAGFLETLSLAAMISLNLAILNLLPVPALDGGHLFFLLIEMIFRRAVSLKVRERAQQAGLILLLAFMAFVFYNDLSRIAARWSDTSRPPQVEQRASPPK